MPWLTLLGWPKVQMGIESLQAFLRSAGALGVWVYTFLERILIPTGLHHFIYGPFIFGPAAVEGGIQMYWAQHLQEFSLSAEPLKSLFPEGGFALHGNSKIFGAVGISLAMYFTAAPENRVKVAGLLIPATLTAMLVGITEPLEFTFLFISPLLFAVHAVLAASMSTVMYLFGVVGNMGGGLIDRGFTAKLDPDVQQPRGYDVDPNRHWVVLYPAVLRGFPHPDSAIQHVHAGT